MRNLKPCRLPGSPVPPPNPIDSAAAPEREIPALDGMRVLDMTQYEAGPSCTQVLAWFGADVVKVEPPERGDGARLFGAGGSSAYSAFFCAWNAGKRSLAIDLDSAQGRDLLRRLAPSFDVFVENYSPGATERFDIGYERLSALNPALIYASIKGYGASGPHAGFHSLDQTAQAAAGAFSVNGSTTGPPLMPGPTIGDSGSGLQAALAVLAAWIQRQRTGAGQFIELSMQEAMTYYLRSRFFPSRMGDARPAKRTGNALGLPPSGLYPCKPFGPNDYIYLQSLTERHWRDLCQAMDRADLRDDPRFLSVPWRMRNHRALIDEISAWTGARTKYQAMEAIAAAGVPCSACLDTIDLHQDRHLTARGFIQEWNLPVHGKVRMLSLAPGPSPLSASMMRPPRLGEHTDELLKGELDLSDAEISALRESGVIGQHADA